jgi:hypothetical protein
MYGRDFFSAHVIIIFSLSICLFAASVGGYNSSTQANTHTRIKLIREKKILDRKREKEKKKKKKKKREK